MEPSGSGAGGNSPPAPDPTRPWWERVRGRLEFELQALDDAGIPYERDEAAFAAGIARLFVHPTVEGERLDLVVTFPDLYPYFRFAVASPRQLGLSHHQAPIGDGTLCLLGRDTGEWRPSDTVAGLLQEQLPRALAAGRLEDRAVAAEVEEQQAEPFSYWYPYAPAMLQIDSAWRIPETARYGEFRARITAAHLVADDTPLMVRGIVTQIFDERGTLLAEVDPDVVAAYSGDNLAGRWTRSPEGIATADPPEFFARAQELDRRGVEAPWVPPAPWRMGPEDVQIQMRGVVFPEEHSHRDASGQGWVFVVRSRRRRHVSPPIPPQSKFITAKRPAAAPAAKWTEHAAFVRAGRAGRGDLARRVPELYPLRDSRVLVVGLGCLGAPSALELARAQIGELRVIDDDVVDPGTVVRWPFGLSAAGMLKAQAIHDIVVRDYPYTKIIAEAQKLGAVQSLPTSDESDQALLERLGADASLIYDASAEFGVQHFLSEYARERGIPYIAVAGSYGGWGGRIVRIRPRVTEGCWLCLQAARTADEVPEPPANPRGTLQAEGCADPTFTAAGFDMVSIAMHGVRLAVSTLCAGAPGAYPDADSDVAVISLRDAYGRLIAPTVQTFPLRRHPDCPACAARSA